MNNYAEFFPILYYNNRTVTRVNGNETVCCGKFCLLPLFSTKPLIVLTISGFEITDKYGCHTKFRSIVLNDELHLPEKCFLVAAREGYPYTPEEVEEINKIWDKLMLKLQNED